MKEEVLYFGRMAAYALIVGVAYWFLSYEAAGTALLIGFGLATAAGFAVLRAGARGAQEADAAGEPGLEGDGPFADESGPVPMRSAAPLAVGVGVAVVGLAGAFGAWFLVAGAVPLLLGAVDWLRSAERELALRQDVDAAQARLDVTPTEPAPPASSSAEASRAASTGR